MAARIPARFPTALILLVAVAASAQIRFEDVAAKAGIKFELHNGAAGDFHQPELMLGGVAVLDYNNDGCMDVFFTNGATMPGLKKDDPKYSNRLFRNNCDGTFTDVTAKAGVAGEGYSTGVAVADYDNDGFPDLYVTGVNRNILYHNRGDGTFEDVTAKSRTGAVDSRFGKLWSVSAAWVDINNDGWLDLFVTNYVQWDPKLEPRCGDEHRQYCDPSAYRPTPNQLFLNNHDGTFTDVSVSSGVAAHLGKGMGVAIADYDGDGKMDIFVANDTMPNFLFHNLGNGKFEEVGLMAGAALGENGEPVASMGADFRDFDNDGRPDIFFTAMLNNSYPLFRNSGASPAFDDDTARSGLRIATRTLTGWGAGLYDFDNDGFKDLFTANAHFPGLEAFLGTTTTSLPNSVFRNRGDGRFADVSRGAGASFQLPGQYRGVAFADFDNDGRVDAVVANINGAARLFRNVTPDTGHWLALNLTGTRSNRDGIGARVTVTLPSGRKLYNHCTTSVGYASSSEALVRFGVGNETSAASILVQWPSGQTQELRDQKADRILAIREPEAERR